MQNQFRGDNPAKPEPSIIATIRKTNTLRTLCRSAYDLQKLRIEQGNRLVAQFKSKLGGKPGKKEDDTIDDEGQDLLKNLKARFKLLTEGVAKEALPSKRKWKGDGLITDYRETVSSTTTSRSSATKRRSSAGSIRYRGISRVHRIPVRRARLRTLDERRRYRRDRHRQSEVSELALGLRRLGRRS